MAVSKEYSQQAYNRSTLIDIPEELSGIRNAPQHSMSDDEEIVFVGSEFGQNASYEAGLETQGK